MVGILLISHGDLCEELLKSNAMVAGPMEQTKTVALHPGDTPEAYGQKIKEAIMELDDGAGVLVLVDMLGGTPYNQIGSLARDMNIAFVTGMNMPMLMVLNLEREADSTLEELAEKAANGAKEGVRMLRRKS